MTPLSHARKAIREADALLITSGAGMGVDSGLPDFRGDNGFWKAYPPFADKGIGFAEMANPKWFFNDPLVAWGFYGHRLNLYRQTMPHQGFQLLLEAALQMKHGYYVLTSNVDGQFQKAGFAPERMVEIHGSIHHLQCSAPCAEKIWSAKDLQMEVDPIRFQANSPLPACPDCGSISRPNILMFGDRAWVEKRSAKQELRFDRWLESIQDKRLVIVECGAGTAIPSIRFISSQIAKKPGRTLIRINPQDHEVLLTEISIPAGALEGLRQIFNSDASQHSYTLSLSDNLPIVLEHIDAYLAEQTFKVAIYVGFLEEPIMRMLHSYFPQGKGISMIPLRGGPTPSVYNAYYDEEGPLPEWLFNEICEGWDCAELLVWNGPLTKTVLRQGIASIGKIGKQMAKEGFPVFLRTIILLGQAATAAGHSSYQWTEYSGFTIGVRIRPLSNSSTASALS
jgi:NAD-dependent SIR2 family protein deacetylase